MLFGPGLSLHLHVFPVDVKDFVLGWTHIGWDQWRGVGGWGRRGGGGREGMDRARI